MRKKWSRLITVDGVRYRYHVAEDRLDDCGLNICIQQAEPTGQRLMSGFRKPMAYTEVGPGHKVGRVLPHAVTPRVVRELISAALANGWLPSESGLGAFNLPGHLVVPQLPRPTGPRTVVV